MDLFDSLDIDTSDKKLKRVQSWYMYEQFKSLEKNQLDAARRLKNKSFQDKILRRELSERKARRRLYDQFGLCQSEPGIKSVISGEESQLGNFEVFECFSKLQEDDGLLFTDNEDELDDGHSQIYSESSKPCTDDFKSIDDIEQTSYAGSSSIAETVKSKDNLADDDKEEIALANQDIAQSIQMQMEAVRQNLNSIEQYTKLCDEDITETDEESVKSFYEQNNVTPEEHLQKKEVENNLFTMWSKLVSFAYQVMQLNHGNCYYDYSSQFMTAVLACDVLRRGINEMCHILQPYVSPVNFEEHEQVFICNTVKRKNLKKYKNPLECKSHRNLKKIRSKTYHGNRNHISLNSGYRNNYASSKNTKKLSFARGSQTIAMSSNKFDNSKNTSYNSIWPQEFSHSKQCKFCCDCSCHTRVSNPMLKLTQYLDEILSKDIVDCEHSRA